MIVCAVTIALAVTAKCRGASAATAGVAIKRTSPPNAAWTAVLGGNPRRYLSGVDQFLNCGHKHVVGNGLLNMQCAMGSALDLRVSTIDQKGVPLSLRRL